MTKKKYKFQCFNFLSYDLGLENLVIDYISDEHKLIYIWSDKKTIFLVGRETPNSKHEIQIFMFCSL